MQKLNETIVLLCMVSAVMSAALSADKIAASIDEVQKKFEGIASTEKRTLTGGTARKFDSSENKIDDTDRNDQQQHQHQHQHQQQQQAAAEYEHAMQQERLIRNDKMLDFYRYFAPSPSPAYPMPYFPYYSPYYQQPYVQPFYSPYFPTAQIGIGPDGAQNSEEYEDDYSEGNELSDNETDDGSRANTRRRPGASKNSPIFYIRLPPTPYMFVPGMGYISQPPTIQPLTPQYPINPFINLPVNYVSNAKPTGVYPWSTPPQQSPSAPWNTSPQQSPSAPWNTAPQQTPPAGPQYATPQFPSYLPPRPQKPYRPKPSTQDSKITHLGSYLFNGRPENIYLMPPYHNPYAAPYHPMANPYNMPQYQTPQYPTNQYQAQQYPTNQYPTTPYQATPYSAPAYNPYSPIYPPAIPNYYNNY